jgi:formylglycine-generating enzyme required for sulfatase activity
MVANWWQGRFPWENTREDGYEGTSPVCTFPPNGFGLYDVCGNVVCAPNYCLRFRPAARQFETVDTSTGHIGFRCVVRDA